MRILIAPDKFKGSLTAAEAANAIADGLRAAIPNAALDLCPLADGGEGTVDAMVKATSGKTISVQVTGPLPRMKVAAPVGILGDGFTAVIEMSAASGLQLLPVSQRDPTRTTTYGTGELMLEAIRMGARKIVLGIGGSATLDGGIGCAQACGCLFTLIDGKYFDPTSRRLAGGDLIRLRSVESPLPVVLKGIYIEVACDVGNPLLGRAGAAAMFGPQKGATPEQIDQLESGLRRLVEKVNRADLADRPGSGAAGGLGFGMMAFFGATLRPGIDVIFNAVDFNRRLAVADLVITGEGSLDLQSLSGKTTVGVSSRCAAAGKPCIALCGRIDLSNEQAAAAGFTASFAINRGPVTVDDSVVEANQRLTDVAFQIAKLLNGTAGMAISRAEP